MIIPTIQISEGMPADKALMPLEEGNDFLQTSGALTAIRSDPMDSEEVALADLTDSPMEISGNAELAIAANSGNGTFDDPYVIDGLGINASGYLNALKISNTDAHLIVRDCNLSYADTGAVTFREKSGLHLVNAQNVTVVNITAFDNENGGIRLDSCNNITITGCHLIDSGRPESVGVEGDGIILRSSSDVLIEDCVMMENRHAGVMIGSEFSTTVDCINITIKDCQISGGSHGIHTSYSNRVHGLNIENCTISDFSYAGFWMNDGVGDVKQTGWIIRNLTVYDGDMSSTMGAMMLKFLTGALLEGVEIRQVDAGHDEGILDLRNCDNMTITDSFFHDNVGTMIQTSYWSYDCQNITIMDSTITNCTSKGIWVDEGSVDITISGMAIDSVLGTNGKGIYVAQSSRVTIQDCTITNNSQYGIYVHSYAHHVDIRGCNISNNGDSINDYGVYLYTFSNNVTVVNNTFTNNNGASAMYDTAHIQAYDAGDNNSWNDSEGGNRWSDWLYPDTNHDGIVDDPYLINGPAGAYDYLPIAGPEDAPPEIRIDSPTDGEILYNTSVDIEWSAWDNQSGLNHFEVQIDGGAWSNVGLNTNYTTVLGQGAHNVKVKAIDNESNEATAEVNFTITILTPPSVPRNLEAAPGDSSVILEWDSPASDGGTPITGYKIYRGTTSGALSFLKDVIGTSTTDSGLTNGQIYYYAVSAVNSEGEGPQSSEVSATPATVPDAPTELTATPGDDTITLAWIAPADGGSDILYYKVFRGLTSGGEIFLSNASIVGFMDEWVEVATTYYYRVSAVNGLGEGTPSNEASAIILVEPGTSTNLTAVATLEGINLTWDAPTFDGGSTIMGYSIYRGVESGNLTWLANCTELEFSDEEITIGVTYYYSIIAFNAVGNGTESDETSATFTTTPSEPQDLQATAGDGQVNLTWSAPSSDGGVNITGYMVYSGTSQTNMTLLITTTDLTYPVTGLTNGQTYYFKVRSVNGNGEGTFSSIASATPVTVPSPPSGPSASAGSDGITITWTAPDDGGSPISGYKIYRSNSSGEETYLTTVTGTQYLDTDVEGGTGYFYIIKAVNAEGESVNSIEVSATASSGDSGSWLWGLIIIPIAAILIGLWFLLGKRKKEREEDKKSGQE